MAVERALAAAGQTVTLRMAFRKDGVLIDPFEVRQVQILDQDFAVLATIDGAAIVHDSTGRYHVDWFIPAAEPVEVHHDRWYATLTTGTCAETQFTLNFFVLPAAAAGTGGAAPYLTLAEARAYVGEELSDADLEKVILRCQAAIERICGQKFLPVEDTRIFNGMGLATLNVRRAVQEVHAIDILGCGDDWSALDISDLRIAPGSRSMLGLGNVVGGPFRNRCGQLLNGNGCGVFPHGFANIRVRASWGAWPAVPEEIKHALGLLIQHASRCDDPLASHTAAHESESTASDWTQTLRKIWTNVIQNAVTGFSEVDSILARYTHGLVVVGVV